MSKEVSWPNLLRTRWVISRKKISEFSVKGNGGGRIRGVYLQEVQTVKKIKIIADYVS